ncbi:hypothetical protein ACGFX4_24685 [Kitasatospora sp. NPDC048365]|uniref:hypothetical protein n=1 Tax=Kitasatospora sp. NPDC048365 TaxID=3364050 RepID=UPI00371EBC20
MSTDNVSEHEEEESLSLAAAVEQIRGANFPDLDSELVASIMKIQRKFSEDRAEARKQTEQLVNRWVAAHAKGTG